MEEELEILETEEEYRARVQAAQAIKPVVREQKKQRDKLATDLIRENNKKLKLEARRQELGKRRLELLALRQSAARPRSG